MISDNHLGGKDIISSKVNFTGDVLKTVERHSANGEEIEVIQSFTYDHGKRLIETIHQINEEDEVAVSIQKYNELGQLSNKKLHGTLQQIDYDYNIRGWLIGINNPNSLDNDLFAMQLDYETGTNPQFNGNISSVTWNSEYYDDLKQYEFEYDVLNRLTKANYANGGDYSTTYDYDKNGNLKSLTRNAKVDNNVEEIDDLVYAYIEGGNQLKRVNDFSTSIVKEMGFDENDANYTIDYDYDANGNMILDKNKGITGVSYNHLNLPTQINIERDENKQIKYIYTATGSKFRKQTLGNAAENITTDYVGAFVYETTDDLEIQFIQTSEGRLVANESGGYNYEYALQDHLGNTRVMFNEAGEVLQDQSYYPFGMSMGDELTFNMPSNLPDNKYLYNGKELQTDYELGWYDYGARFYDPAIGRWHVVDPLATETYNLIYSPYNYCINNPFLYIDPDGMDWKVAKDPITGGVVYNLTVQVDNSSGLSPVELEDQLEAIKKTFEKVFSGTDEDGVEYSTKLIIDMEGDDEESNDFVIDFVSEVKDNEGNVVDGASGSVDPDGNHETNRIQILAGRGVEETARTGAHELGHTGYLRHSNLDNTDSFGNSVKPDNIMFPKRNSASGTITGAQLKRINKSIKNGGKLAPPNLKLKSKPIKLL